MAISTITYVKDIEMQKVPTLGGTIEVPRVTTGTINIGDMGKLLKTGREVQEMQQAFRPEYFAGLRKFPFNPEMLRMINWAGATLDADRYNIPANSEPIESSAAVEDAVSRNETIAPYDHDAIDRDPVFERSKEVYFAIVADIHQKLGQLQGLDWPQHTQFLVSMALGLAMVQYGILIPPGISTGLTINEVMNTIQNRTEESNEQEDHE